MLSEALFFVAYLVMLPIVFMFPYAGALAYEWLQYMPPYSVYNTYGLSYFSVIMGGLGIGLWAVKDKKEAPAPLSLLITFALYIIWVSITQVTSIVGDAGSSHWDRAWKVLLFTFVLSFMARTRGRIEAFIWVICLAVGNFVISGAIKTILSGGGGYTIVGGSYNILGERVSFAVAVSTIIPLVRYLRNHAILVKRTKTLTVSLDLFTIACVATVVGTQARTGILALAVLAAFYFVHSKNKLAYLLSLPVLMGFIFIIAPPEWFERMGTISSHDDASSEGRFASWAWGWQFALEHPILGGGFHSFVLHHVPSMLGGMTYLEAHNILIETLCDHGFVGLGLYLMMIIGTLLSCRTMSKRARAVPELEWAGNLGSMLSLAMLTFMTGSQLISDATQSVGYELVALTLGGRGIVERYLAAQRQSAIAQALVTPRRNPFANVGVPAMAYRRQQ